MLRKTNQEVGITPKKPFTNVDQKQSIKKITISPIRKKNWEKGNCKGNSGLVIVRYEVSAMRHLRSVGDAYCLPVLLEIHHQKLKKKKHYLEKGTRQLWFFSKRISFTSWDFLVHVSLFLFQIPKRGEIFLLWKNECLKLSRV